MAIEFRTPRVLMALILREMSTTYGRSAIGYLWVIAEPVLGIVLMTLAFGLLLRTPPLGNDFALFYATGLVPFTMYLSVSGKVAQAVNFSRQLLFYPRLTFLDAVLARFILNAFTQLMIAYLIFAVILMSQDTRAVLDLNAILLSLAMGLSLAFGVGTLNCLLFSFIPSWQAIWSVLNRPMFLVSGIFFLYDHTPDSIRPYLWYNPLVHVVGQMRKGFYPTYSADYVSIPYVMAWAAVPGVLGIFFLRRYHKKILNEL